MTGKGETLRFGPYTVETSNPDKLLYPDDGITKAEVIDYYRRVAEHALPHVRDRFLTLQRFPDGLGEDGFYQQSRSEHFPDFVSGGPAERVGGGEIEHIAVDNAAGLVYLADQATLTFHAWLSRRDRLDRPDRLVFDLDPPGEDFEPARRAAGLVGGILRELALEPFLMTTGSRGLHVVAVLDRSTEFDAVRDFARQVADTLAARHPDTLTVAQRKAKRRGRLYLDVMRNAYGQTAVMPYSLRAKPGAPLATPLGWDELEDKALDSRRYTIANLFRRLGQIRDPWSDMNRHAASVSAASRRLAALQAAEPGSDGSGS